MNTLTTTQVRALLDSGAGIRLIDVRSPGEFAAGHIPGSANVPLDLLRRHSARLRAEHDDQVVLVCRSGVRARDAHRIAAAAGLAAVSVLDGGLNAWESQGAPVNRGRGTWAMERQVRMAAGGIVLAGVAGSVVWKPAKWVAGAVGAGLAFSALTDTCAMARALSVLPWNRTAAARPESETLAALVARP
ncbi:rhodanese-related sulfurtransferase [Nonomuraea thailandensis]|uniref:Rhodanese-related sulfurtransferase n=1 Tax=Nonomuraea thailandensis TaxID=1188745 RepID=A0A9X2GLS4_9ACTN|nr:rhodanese-like domain-containing protein [Nonomuraea thailandensis]MCP2360065.1 rhodanese-related sulfurtransferase [Nonomuraea thailandensis]